MIANQLATKPIKVMYFTDPICSACWGIEPQLLLKQHRYKMEKTQFYYLESSERWYS